MRILLDECLPRLLKRDIVEHEVSTVTEMGWAGLKNGELFGAAEGDFEVLVTVDRGIEYQQNFSGRQISLLVLDAPSQLPKLRLLVPALLEALETIQPGAIIHVGSPLQ